VSRNDVILGVVALVLVGFSLVVALVLPRRRPDFPGNRVGLFTLLAVALVAAMLTSVEVFGAEDHAEEGDAAEAEGPAHAEADPGEGDTGEAGETETGETEGESGGEGGEPAGDVARGEEVFASEGCGNCHILEAAGTSGTVGPNLDEASPSLEEAVEQVTNGGGGMPAFGGELSEEDIGAVAAYVVESSQ
jgi:mono/diheme cytochrome c family protein